MKRTIFGAVALAACVGMASTALAQNETYKYSSYGIQEAADDAASPSDVAIDAIQDGVDAADPSANDIVGSAVANGCGTSDCCGSSVVCNNDRNITFGLRGLVFTRDFESEILFGNNAFGDCLCSTHPRETTMAGFETFLGVRNCSGFGWEIGYWGLYPDYATTTLGGPPLTTALTGLNDLDLGGIPGVDIIFDNADFWQSSRYNEIQNLELNLLRNAGTTRGFFCGCVNIEWLAGVRFFRFEEDMQLAAFNTAGGFPQQSIYDFGVDNTLAGFQLGGRADRCLSDCLSLSLGVKFGIYNNDIDHNQSIRAGDGTPAVIAVGPDAGTDYVFSTSNNDVATMGELDLGLHYNFARCWRGSVGYRAIGVAGVALAPHQIPRDFSDSFEILDINNNGDLLLHGAYFGIERAF